MKQRHRGVTWEKQKNKWKARVGGKFIGFFDDYDEAGACAKKARQLLGLKEYCKTKEDVIRLKNVSGAQEKIGLILAAIGIMESDIAKLRNQVEIFAESIVESIMEDDDEPND